MPLRNTCAFLRLTPQATCIFDAEEKLKKYGCVEDIVKDYYGTRLKMYRQRIAYIIDVLQKELALLSNKAKYITENLEGTII